MVTSSIPEKHRIPSPLLVFLVQHRNQFLYEELHDVSIRISLEKRGVDCSMAIKGYDEGDSWNDLDGWSPLSNLPLLPTSSEIITRVNPGLVDGDDSLFGLNDLEELDCSLLSLYAAPLLVGQWSQLDYLSIPHVQQ